MRTTRINGATWLTRAPRGGEVALRPARPRRAAVFLRTLSLAALGAGLCLTTVVAVPPPGPARAEKAAERPSAPATKHALRLAAWNGPLVTRPAALSEAGLLDSLATAPAARFAALETSVTGALASAASFTPRPAAATAPLPAWREEEFARADAVDGRTLLAGETRIRLAGLDLPAAEEVCRTLDGRLESCAARAATVLELQLRHRRVSCRYQAPVEGGMALGTCRLGAGDLAERLLRAGYARRSADAT